MNRLLQFSLLGVLSFGVCPGTAKSTTIIDQFDEFQGGGFLNIPYFSPMGQSFTPTLDSLNFIQIFPLNNFEPGLATLQLAVFPGIFSGPPLGLSEPIALPFGFEGISTFIFPSPVSLVPGQLYSFEVSETGNKTVFLNESGFNNYSGGTAIVSGNPATGPPGNDFWFVEGVQTVDALPEPSSFTLLGLGLTFVCLLHVLGFSHLWATGSTRAGFSGNAGWRRARSRSVSALQAGAAPC